MSSSIIDVVNSWSGQVIQSSNTAYSVHLAISMKVNAKVSAASSDQLYVTGSSATLSAGHPLAALASSIVIPALIFWVHQSQVHVAWSV